LLDIVARDRLVAAVLDDEPIKPAATINHE
jgi:hypothetical protein